MSTETLKIILQIIPLINLYMLPSTVIKTLKINSVSLITIYKNLAQGFSSVELKQFILLTGLQVLREQQKYHQMCHSEKSFVKNPVVFKFLVLIRNSVTNPV